MTVRCNKADRCGREDWDAVIKAAISYALKD